MFRSSFGALLASALSLALSVPAVAAPGDLDSGFGNGGRAFSGLGLISDNRLGLISDNGLGLIGTASGNLIGTAAGNLIGTAAGNVVAAGSAN